MLLAGATHSGSYGGRCCCWVKGDVTVTGGETVWDFFVFWHLQWYPSFKVLGVGQEMIEEVNSSTSMRTPVETKDLISIYVETQPMVGLVTISTRAVFPS
jgi:hypothetical protein